MSSNPLPQQVSQHRYTFHFKLLFTTKWFSGLRFTASLCEPLFLELAQELACTWLNRIDGLLLDELRNLLLGLKKCLRIR
jgi:hypothetical protein